MIRKVKFFESSNDIWSLQYKINNFLKTIHTGNIIDIKYNHILLKFDKYLEDPNIYNSAMVVYDEKEDDPVPEGFGVVEGGKGVL